MLNAFTPSNKCLGVNHTRLGAPVDNNSYVGLAHMTGVHLKRNLKYTGKAGVVAS